MSEQDEDKETVTIYECSNCGGELYEWDRKCPTCKEEIENTGLPPLTVGECMFYGREEGDISGWPTIILTLVALYIFGTILIVTYL